MNKIITSAPGKVILTGEHAVLYNQPGLVSAIDRRTTVELTKDPFFTLSSARYQHPYSLTPKGFKELIERIDRITSKIDPQERYAALQPMRKEPFWDFYPIMYVAAQAMRSQQRDFNGFNAVITSDVPKNLGSSSSTYAALACAVIHHVNSEVTYYRTIVERLANIGDTLAHGGKASGIDSYAASFGGMGSFTQALKGISFEHAHPLTLLTIDSGEDYGTASPVQHIRKEYLKGNSTQTKILTVMQTLGEITEKTKDALATNNLPALEALFDVHYSTLKSLTISTPKLDEIITLAQEQGLHAKPTGSWGGGCCIAPIRESNLPNLEQYIAYFAKRGYTAFPITTHAEGVRLEKEKTIQQQTLSEEKLMTG